MDIVVIGGGAAGMMAAVAAAGAEGSSVSGNRVFLIEKNEKLGKKLFITGKGRCNVTNACEVEDFFQHVMEHANFCTVQSMGLIITRSWISLKEQAVR